MQLKRDEICKWQSGWQRGVFALLLLASVFNATAAQHPHADLSRLVIVGDSLLAGFQNGSLMASQQTNGIAALIARQGKTDLALPLIANPGIPNVLTLVSSGPPPVSAPLAGPANVTVTPLNGVEEASITLACSAVANVPPTLASCAAPLMETIDFGGACGRPSMRTPDASR